MNTQRFEFNPFGENTYIIWDPATNDAAVIDPGMTNGVEMDAIERFISNNKLNIKYILLTHVHVDHTFGIDMLKERYDVPVLAHKDDAPLGLYRQQQADMFHLRMKLPPLEIDRFISDGNTLELGHEQITVIGTPGHSRGGICFYIPDSHMIFTGDTLFKGSIGRTDFPEGSHSQLIKSVKTKLLTLPSDTIVYPGHGNPTSIGDEAMTNPFL